MNRPLFLFICISCFLGGLTFVALGIENGLPQQELAGTFIFIGLILPALAWLRLRRAKHRQQTVAEWDRILEQVPKNNSKMLSEDSPRVSKRRFRRRLISLGLLLVGVILSIQAPDKVLGRTSIPIGWIVSLAGFIMLAGDYLGYNVFHHTELDNRLDQLPSREKDEFDQR